MIHRLLPLSVVLLTLTGCATPSRVDFRPKLKPGCEVHYVVTSRTDGTRKIESASGEPPREIKSVHTHDVGMHLRCREVREDGSAVLEWSLPYVAITMEDRMPMAYDSRDPAQAESPLGSIFSQLIGQPATVTVDASGEVIDFKDPASIGGGPIRHFMDSLLSKKAYQFLDLLAMDDAPSDVAVDAGWSGAQAVELSQGLGTMLVSSNYELQGVTDRGAVAEIAVHGTMSMKDQEPAEDGTPTTQAAQPSLVINVGEFAGKIMWDCVTGQVISRESQSKLIGTATGTFGKIAIEDTTATTVKRMTPEEFRRAAEKPTPPEPEEKPEPTTETQPAAGD